MCSSTSVVSERRVLAELDLADELEAADHPREPLPVVDPLLLLEGCSEEQAAWQQLTELEHQRTVLHVRQCQTIARGYVLARGAGRGREDVLGELMGSWQVSRRAAEIALEEALQLIALPRLVAAALDTPVGLRQVKALLEVLRGVDPVLADQVVDRALPKLGDRDPARVKDAARYWIAKLDPDAAVRRHREAAQRRTVLLRDAGDGMAEISLLVRVEQGLAILQQAERAADAPDHTGRTRDQRRLDWIVDTLLGGPAAPAAGETGGTADRAGALVPDGRRRRPVQLLVHVPVTTALGLDDEPCRIQGAGWLDADHVQRLISTAELRKVCVDECTGQVLHVEDAVHRPVADRARIDELTGQGLLAAHAAAQAQAEAARQVLLELVHQPSVAPRGAEPQYRPSAALARTVRTAHPTCDFPGVNTPARSCDLDHTRPWPYGGTELSNLSSRSRWAHQRKQHGWTPRPQPDGSTEWTSPSGRTYTNPPPWDPPPPLDPLARLQPPAPPPAAHDGIPASDLDLADLYDNPALVDHHEQPLDLAALAADLRRPVRPGPVPEPRRATWPDDPQF